MKNERILSIIFIFITIPFLVLVLLSTFTVSSLKLDSENAVSLRAGWSYNDPETGKPERTNLPATIRNIAVYKTLRISNILPGDEFEDPTLFFETQQQYVKVLLNKEPIYEFKPEMKWFGHSPGNAIHFVNLPDGYQSATVEILLTSPYRLFSGKVFEVYLGNKSFHILRLIKKDSIPLIVALAFLFLGLFLVIAYTALYFFKVKDHGILYLAIFALFAGIWMVLESRTVLLFINDPVFVSNVSLVCLYFLPIPLLLFARNNFLSQAGNTTVYLSWIFIIFILTSALLQIFNLTDFISVRPIFQLLTLSAATMVGWITLREFRAGNKKIRPFVFGSTVLLGIMLCDVALYYLAVTPRIGYFGLFQVGMLFLTFVTVLSLKDNLHKLREINIRNELLLYLAYTDVLTDLKNRTSFDEKVKEINSKLESEDSIHMIILDINNLKKTNDTLGHKEGDRLISDGAKIIKRTLGRLSEIYRIGGDEFAIILRDKNDLQINNAISELFEEIDRYNKTADKFKMSIAFGMAAYIKGIDRDLNSVFIRADKAMYNCKVNQKQIQVIG